MPTSCLDSRRRSFLAQERYEGGMPLIPIVQNPLAYKEKRKMEAKQESSKLYEASPWQASLGIDKGWRQHASHREGAMPLPAFSNKRRRES